MVLAVEPLARHWDDLAADRFAPVLDRSPEGIALVEHGRVLYANPVFVGLTGLAGPQETIGQSLTSIRPEFDCECSLDTCEAGPTCAGHPVCEFDRVRSDGTTVRVEASCGAFPWENRNLLIVNLRDVTERERRRALHESERRLRAIFHAVAIGMAQCTPDGRIVESNPAIEHMLGYSHQELCGMTLTDFFPDGGADHYFRLFSQSSDVQLETFQSDLRYIGKMGVQGWVRFTASLVPGENDDPPFVIAITEEITEYKRAERRLRASATSRTR